MTESVVLLIRIRNGKRPLAIRGDSVYDPQFNPSFTDIYQFFFNLLVSIE